MAHLKCSGLSVIHGRERLDTRIFNDLCRPLNAGKNLLCGLLQLWRWDEIKQSWLRLIERRCHFGLHLLLYYILNNGLHTLLSDSGATVHLLTFPPYPLMSLVEVVAPEGPVEVPEVTGSVRSLLSLDKLRVEGEVVSDAVLPLLIRGGVEGAKIAVVRK